MSVEELLTWAGSAGSTCPLTVEGGAGVLLLGIMLLCTTLGAGGGGGGWLFDEDDSGARAPSCLGSLRAREDDGVTSSLALSTEWGLSLTFNFSNCCTSC